MKQEIYMGHGLYKYIEVEVIETIEGDMEWRIVKLEGGGFIRRPFPIQTVSQQMQDELEPIFHKKEFEKDCPECADREADEILTGQAFSGLPFSSYQPKLEPIIHPTQHDESDDIEEAKSEEMTEFEKAEYKRKIAGVKKRSVWGDHPEKDFLDRVEKYYFSKGEKWEHKYDT